METAETRLQNLVADLRTASERLAEVLAMPETVIVRDAAIQRFEFTFELSWKVMKEYLREVHGRECLSPKECIREAYRVNLLQDERWLEAVELRNLTAHTYNEVIAEQLFRELPHVLLMVREFLRAVAK